MGSRDSSLFSYPGYMVPNFCFLSSVFCLVSKDHSSFKRREGLLQYLSTNLPSLTVPLFRPLLSLHTTYFRYVIGLILGKVVTVMVFNEALPVIYKS